MQTRRSTERFQSQAAAQLSCRRSAVCQRHRRRRVVNGRFAGRRRDGQMPLPMPVAPRRKRRLATTIWIWRHRRRAARTKWCTTTTTCRSITISLCPWTFREAGSPSCGAEPRRRLRRWTRTSPSWRTCTRVMARFRRSTRLGNHRLKAARLLPCRLRQAPQPRPVWRSPTKAPTTLPWTSTQRRKSSRLTMTEMGSHRRQPKACGTVGLLTAGRWQGRGTSMPTTTTICPREWLPHACGTLSQSGQGRKLRRNSRPTTTRTVRLLQRRPPQVGPIAATAPQAPPRWNSTKRREHSKPTTMAMARRLHPRR
mmetsp:Transcript_19284/g.52957  ORF Transcript_19284/g.52957 Transcript_19284/m.52957 type:complete len:311 (+) Transcript_19284:155-1087(+)